MAYCYKITDVGLAHISTLLQLTSLNLSDCVKITDTGLVHISKLLQLTSLNLSDCKSLTSLPGGMGQLTSLKELNLCSTAVSPRFQTSPASSPTASRSRACRTTSICGRRRGTRIRLAAC